MEVIEGMAVGVVVRDVEGVIKGMAVELVVVRMTVEGEDEKMAAEEVMVEMIEVVTVELSPC